MGFIKNIISTFSNKKFGQTGVNVDSENYIENKHDALNIICTHLSRFSESKDPNLETLRLWIVTPDGDDQVAWADAQFIKELKARFHQELITAIKQIEVIPIATSEITSFLENHFEVNTMVANRLFYSFSNDGAIIEGKVDAPHHAWLLCIAGMEYVQSIKYQLNPSEKRSWNIGRSEKPTATEFNDIVIRDDCKSISRQHAAIVVDNGHYYLKCKNGGCRAKGGGGVTKITRAANNKTEELMTTSLHYTDYLKEGDVIALSGSVFYKFMTNEPKETESAIQSVDNSF